MDIAAIGLIEDEDILLDLASLALSQLDHENADIAHYLDMLEDIEDRVCAEGRSAFLPEERAAALSRVLHGELGFVGDDETYDAPVNADFIRVLDRKRGLPIALSILYVAMARRTGWSAYVLNLPGKVHRRDRFLSDEVGHGARPLLSGRAASLNTCGMQSREQGLTLPTR